VLDTYPRSFATTVHSLAVESPLVQTKHGLFLVAAERLGTAPRLDRVILPGSPDSTLGEVVQHWATDRKLSAERVHASGAYPYDATLRDMAHADGRAVVNEAATGIEYPTPNLGLEGPLLRFDLLLRPLALGLLGLGALLLVRGWRRPGPGLRLS
jgi:hypothetical protein